MKVLQLCNKPPYPPVDGGTMAMNSITQGLLDRGCEVKVLTVETDKHPACIDQLPPDYMAATRMEAVYVDLRVKPLPAAVAMLCGESYHVQRYISADFAAKLHELLESEQFDIVHIESIFLTPYVPLIRKHAPQAKVILRAHNVEHRIWQRVASSMRHGLKRWYIKHLALTLRAYEVEHLNDYDGIVAITGNDADFFTHSGYRRPVAAIPFGVEPEEVPGTEVEPCSLFHIGAMDWLPNLEGIDWMLEKVWPLIHTQLPQATLYLAGRKMPHRLMNAGIEGVRVVGEVPDAGRFIASKQINVVPLLSGSGIRVKIIEAMSMGKAVVTTSVGAQGIDAVDGKHLLIADTPEAFATAVRRCIDEPELCKAIGQAAAALTRERYDSRTLAINLTEFYNKIAER